MTLDLQQLIQWIDHLKPEERNILADYLRQNPSAPMSIRPPRILGAVPDVWMSEDFEKPLPEDIWNWDEE
jgi:hypothetical protein